MGTERTQRASHANLIVGGVIVLALVAGFAWLWLTQQAASDASLKVLVHDGDGATHELALDADDTLTVTTSFGTNVITVQDGQVSVTEADCGNQDCVHQGTISQPGQQIICLPHQLWVEIAASADDAGTMDISAVNGADGNDGLDVTSR